MTRRTVVWVIDAESELAELWLRSKSRNQISLASQSIDATLGEHAESVGMVLSEEMKAFSMNLRSESSSKFSMMIEWSAF